MQPFVQNLSREDMLDLAAFFAGQKPRDPGFKADPAKVQRGRKKAEETLCTMCHLGASAPAGLELDDPANAAARAGAVTTMLRTRAMPPGNVTLIPSIGVTPAKRTVSPSTSIMRGSVP